MRVPRFPGVPILVCTLSPWLAGAVLAGDSRLVTEEVVEAPAGEVWAAMTTREGLESWMVALAEIDLRIGGKMLTRYEAGGRLGDAATIENTIISFEPERMLSIRVTRAPEKFPFRTAVQSMWTVIYFEPLGPARTRVEVVSLGFDDTDESKKMREHFRAGNAWTLRKLAQHFAPSTSAAAGRRPDFGEGGAAAGKASAAAPDDLAPVRLDVELPATRADVWAAWTTNAGIESFFAPRARIELRPGGAYEVLFAPDEPEGRRGAEGLEVLSFLPGEMLSFEWSAPPSFPAARPQRTWVVLQFDDAGERRTRLRLSHLGFAERAAERPAERDEWIRVRSYFREAWPAVLARLETRFRTAEPRAGEGR